LTLAQVTIPKQQIALATLGAWIGDGISSGILGLGLPGLTESFRGKSPIEDGLQNLVNYNPVVTTITNQIGKHIFSLGLSQNESESFLAVGGVPQDVKVGNYSRVPIEKVALPPLKKNNNNETLRTKQERRKVGNFANSIIKQMPRSFGRSDYFYYALTPERMVWKNNHSAVTEDVVPQLIVDSGTTLNVFPYGIVHPSLVLLMTACCIVFRSVLYFLLMHRDRNRTLNKRAFHSLRCLYTLPRRVVCGLPCYAAQFWHPDRRADVLDRES